MSKIRTLAFASASMIAFAAPAMAQDAAPASDEGASNEIVVQARRKGERLQDVPKVVNVVTADELDKLKIRQFADVASTVPGLNLTDAGTGYTQQTTMRGISFDVNSGADAAVDFYLNDASIQQGFLFRSLYDIGQIEVLRGPQGTLRGRATPSGAITFTTHKPDLNEVGGYVDGTLAGGRIGDLNLQGAVNLPIIKDKLAIRVSAMSDDSDGNGVRPALTDGQERDAVSIQPFMRTTSERVSVRFEPTDNLQFNVMYQHMFERFHSYEQTQSTCLFTNSCAPGTAVVAAADRLSTVNGASDFREVFDVLTGNAAWHVGGQVLNYVGSYSVGTFDASGPQDAAAITTAYYQTTHSRNQYQSHEIRLSSEQRIAGLFDYTLGFFTINTPTANSINGGAFKNYGVRKETSVFGNVTAHLTDKFEIAGGIRQFLHISNYSVDSFGVGNTYGRWKKTIWTGSASYHFNPDIMAYVSAGTSFRPGTSSVGPILTPAGQDVVVLAPNFKTYVNLQPEYSHSYEAGIKTRFANRRGTFNITYYHQDFSNYQYANMGLVQVYGVKLSDVLKKPPVITPASAFTSGLGANVPVKVDGIEGDLGYHFSPNLDLGATFSYAYSKITGGTFACNSGGTIDPTAGVQVCAGHGPASFAPRFSATVRGEYNHDLNDWANGYLRTQIAINGATPLNPDPSFAFSKQKAYALVNLFAGVRDKSGAWDLSVFVKNAFNDKTILADVVNGNTPANTGLFQSPTYSFVNIVAPRTFGVNLRYAFGSR